MTVSQHPSANGPYNCADPHQHHHQHYSHAGKGARRAGDLILVLLAILCPPAVAHIKTGRRDLTLSIVLTLFGWAPGIFHAWWMILQHPGCHRCDRYGCSSAFPVHSHSHGHEAPAFTRSSPDASEHGNLPAAHQPPQVTQQVRAPPPPPPPQQAMGTPTAGIVSPVHTGGSGLAAWSGGSVKDHKGEQQEELPRYVV